MIPELLGLPERAGVTAVFLPLAIGVLIAGLLFAAQSIATWFDDRNPWDPFRNKENRR